ncbi:hypothetical protein E3Q10_04382 [Wallemia mellicola]|uniref:Uncharacterized protein n=1 Tax=Wallemia mellicola TaxID=1708541 RepID=A0A4T0QHR5_9BASI|nr:hypothetical protein E3Q10_04382 [Wallemia mellicola]
MDRLHNIAKQIDKNDENVNILLTAIRNLGQQLQSLQQHAASFDESQYNSSATQLQAELEGSIPRIQDNLVQNDNLIQRMMDLFFELDAGPHLDKLSTEFGNYQQVHLEKRDLIDGYNHEEITLETLVASWPQDNSIKQLSSEIDELSALFASSGL